MYFLVMDLCVLGCVYVFLVCTQLFHVIQQVKVSGPGQYFRLGQHSALKVGHLTVF